MGGYPSRVFSAKDGVTEVSTMPTDSCSAISGQSSRSPSLLSAETCSTLEHASPRLCAEDVASSSREVGEGCCSRVLGKLARRHRVGDSGDDSADRQNVDAWPSATQSMSVKLILHIGASPLVLAPTLCWRYGGIVAYLPVVFLMVTSVVPLHFLESFTGHYTGRSVSVALSRLGPILQALGHALLVLTVLMGIYYMQFVAWVLLYAFHACLSSPQWSTCSAAYNSQHCYTAALQDNCTRASPHSVYYDFRCISAIEYCRRGGHLQSNGTHCWGSRLAEQRLVSGRLADSAVEAGRAAAVPLSGVGRRLPAHTDFFRSYVSGSAWSGESAEVEVTHRHYATETVAYTAGWLLLLLPCLSLRAAGWFATAAAVVSPAALLLVTGRVLVMPGARAGVARLFSAPPPLPARLGLGLCADAVLLAHTGVGVGGGVVTSVASRDRHGLGTLAASTLIAALSLGLGLLNTVLLFAARGHLELSAGEPLPHADNAPELVLVTLSQVLVEVPAGRMWGVLYFSAVALHSLAALSVVIISVEVHLVDALAYCARRPLHIVALATCTVAYVCGGVLTGYAWPRIRMSVSRLLDLQWSAGLLLLAAALGLKMAASPRRAVALRSALGGGGRLWRPLRLSWLLVSPLAAVCLMLVLGGRLGAQRPPGPDWPAVVGYTAALLPPLAAIATCLRVCGTVHFRALLSAAEGTGTTSDAQPLHRREKQTAEHAM